MEGLKETLEVIEGAKSLAVDAIEALKDGAQIEDINVIIKNIDKLKLAVEGAGKMGDELKDLDALEIKELVSAGVDMVFAILAAVKAPKA